MATQEIRVPDLGDVEAVEVIELCVAPGDRLAIGDALLVVESDKASMDLPSTLAGTLVRFAVAAGDQVQTGQLIAEVEVAEGESAEGESAEAEAADDVAKASAAGEARTTADAPTPAKPTQPHAAAPVAQSQQPASVSVTHVYAGPAVRRHARELGVDLQQVQGSADKGRIVKEDVDAYVRARLAQMQQMEGQQVEAQRVAAPLPDFARFGAIETQPLSATRVKGARNLAQAWRDIPHVTQHGEADVSALQALRQQLQAAAEAQAPKLSLLPFILRALVRSLQAFPSFNASLAADGTSLILKHYWHLGIAVDTPQGLVVPVLRDAEQKDIWALAAELAALADAARRRRLQQAQLQGASFSVSSLGALGGTGFTPLINPPEVAILGVAALQTKPVWDGAAFVPRQLLPLSLSYDHRVINGADAGRFLQHLIAALQDAQQLAP